MKGKFLTSRNKLFFGFLCIVLICSGVILINQYLNNKQIQMKNQLLSEKNILIEIQKINRLGLISDNEGSYYFLITSNDKKKQLIASYYKNVEEINLEIENLRTMLNRTEDIRALSKFEKSWQKNIHANDRAFQLENEGHYDSAKKVYTAISYEDVKRNLASLGEQQTKLVDQKERDFEQYSLIIFRINTGITITFILFTITLGWILSRKIQLEHYIITQEQFYQNTSHELKTPLMSIQGYAQAILDGTIEQGKVAESLKVIINESDRLKRMVTEIIFLSKLESKHNLFEWHIVPIEFLIEEAIFRINPLIKEKRVDVQLHLNYINPSRPPFVKVDPEKFLQALLNILSNALRHTEHKIDVSISDKGKQVWIDIKDNGSGISDKALPNLFERFFIGEDGETGLGLAIARAIIEQSGGSIKAWNDKDGGAVFRISLPIAMENKN